MGQAADQGGSYGRLCATVGSALRDELFIGAALSKQTVEAGSQAVAAVSDAFRVKRALSILFEQETPLYHINRIDGVRVKG